MTVRSFIASRREAATQPAPRRTARARAPSCGWAGRGDLGGRQTGPPACGPAPRSERDVTPAVLWGCPEDRGGGQASPRGPWGPSTIRAAPMAEVTLSKHGVSCGNVACAGPTWPECELCPPDSLPGLYGVSFHKYLQKIKKSYKLVPSFTSLMRTPVSWLKTQALLRPREGGSSAEAKACGRGWAP